MILDEAQNTTPVQMKMFLTRMGEGTRMVVTGDLSQVDLPPGTQSGLRDALDTLEGVPGIGVVRFDRARRGAASAGRGDRGRLRTARRGRGREAPGGAAIAARPHVPDDGDRQIGWTRTKYAAPRERGSR